MKCPNRNSKEFKTLQSSNGIDTGTLELIIQKYWIQSGNEDSFPTDVYVQSQLGRYPHWSPVKKATQLWEKMYSTPREFDSAEKREAFIKANLVEQCFSPRAIYKYTTSDGKYALAISRPVSKVDFDDFLPGKELSTEEMEDLELVMKEFIKETVRNDGTAIMDDLMEQKDAFMRKLQKKGSETTRTFTFRDGMTVSTPFELNYQQKDALNEMDAFIKSDEPVMTLSGYAGTGKTSIMEIMAHKLRRDGKEVLFSASTNKAASVLRDRVSKAGFNAQTLHRIFGIQVEVDRSKPYNANNLIQKLNEKDFIPGTIVVIDEASMIDNNVYNVIKDIARHFKLKIIFVGDPAQLKPVKEDQISKVFRNTDGRQVTLTKVERTGDNAILEEATRIRNGEGLSGKSSFNSKGEGVAYVKPSSRNTIESIVKHYVNGLRSNPNYFRILAYTNATVARYNTMVRNFLGYKDNIPRVGEPILGYKNWGKQYNKYTKETTYRFINSESYEVVAVEAPQMRSVRVNGSEVEIEVVPVTLKDSFGKVDNIDFIDIKGNPRNLQAATIIAREKARLSDYMNSHQLSKAEYAMTQDTVNYLESFLFINDDITEPDPSNPSQRRALQKKYFDFGYAMTIHKSQGSTFTNVLVDDHDVVTSTGSSQAMTSLDFGGFDEDNLSPTDSDYEALASGIDLDFSGGSNETLFTPAPQATPSTSEVNQMQQQLEYVAVSRATDTVTVISNNTSNEDSPLNHLKEAARTEQRKAEKKYDTEEFYSKQGALDYIADLEAEGVERSRIVLTHIPETDTTDDYYTVSVNPEGIVPENTIASQMIDHLRSMGIPVLTQADMIEYFNAHNNSIGDVQQATDIQMAIDENSLINKLKPQYRGKLIYAQSGTGKSTLADNITVFDSDYLLGQILGVSTETAGFFFKTLSKNQKIAFGKQYRDLIKQKVAEGYTVLTANKSLLEDADVVVYNQSAEETDKRVNNVNRAISNRYSALEYHKETLEQINKLKQNENNKEYIELGEGEYLGNHLLSDRDNGLADNADLSSDTGSDNRSKSQTRLTQEEIVGKFLDAFDITVNHLDEYDGELPLFDALNRTINARTAKDITNGVGYAIAFMMQSDPEMQHIVMMSHGSDSNYGKRVYVPTRGVVPVSQVSRVLLPLKGDVIRDVGNRIAEEIRRNFDSSLDEIKTTEENKAIWTIIRNFFNKLKSTITSTAWNIATFGRRNKAVKESQLFIQDVVEALAREDFSRIKGPLVKEKTTEKAQIVDAEQAFRDNPYEAEIIKKLSDAGIALAGSTSIALEGTLYRPSENPMHDIDFNAGDNSSKETLDKLLPKVFGKNRIAFSSMIHKGWLQSLLTGDKKGNDCVTYVTLDRPFEVRNQSRWHEEYYDKEGNYLGKREGTELQLEEGVKGKILDFFVGPTQESDYGFYKKTIDGVEYLLSNSKAAFAAKVLWARPKDMWDYKNFRRNQSPTEVNDVQTFETPQGEVYGFVTKDGKIYLDETVISPEHPIHEYTHLWDNVLRDKNPELWKKGVSLMKKFTYTKDGKTVSLWKEIEDSDQYGKQWRSKGYTGEELEHLIASEVHARLVGENGAKLLEDIASKKGSDKIIEKLKQWILDVWKELKATFSNWTQEEIDKLTLKDFNHMVVRDFADGINPMTQEMPTPPQPVGGNEAQIQVSREGKLPEKGEEMVNRFRAYYLWQREHIKFDEKSHTYYLDGKPIDYSVTEYMETVYGAPNIIGDYSHSRQMGNDVDALTRDFFIRKVDVSKQQYPNLNEERKAEVVSDLQRLKQHFDEEFGEGKYKVITSPMVLVGTITVNGETKTIAGTMDMIVVDENGDIYPFDMKVKNHPITKTYNGKEVDDRRNYTFQLNGYRQLMQIAIPETSGRIKPARLIWFDTAYPKQGKEALFTTDAETHVVTVSDANNRNIPLAKYALWQTPRLKENITESLIPLETKDVLPDVRKVTSIQQQPAPKKETVFIESTGGYPQRTRENADWSDITIALATDFNTAGEKLTKRVAGNKYVSSTIDSRVNLDNLAEGIAASIFEQLDDKGKTKNLKLNIAGNGIYTLANNYTQEQINDLVYKVLRKLLSNGITISEIRSGGQTGVDEAGIIAAQRLGIPSSVNAPKGFAFRDVNGKDHSNKEEFIARFQQQPVQQSILSQGKTAQYSVQIDSNLINNYKQWQQNNPSGIVAYRVNKASFNTPASVEQGIIGNPFDWQKYGTGKATEMFYDWLITGNNYGESLATEEFRNAIINKIQQSQTGTPILYYKELDRPSHATVIGYLINNKQLLSQQQSANSANERLNNATQKHQGNWTRQEAQNNPRTLYVFTDNTDRDSGSGVIPANSWYSKKYGEGHHFPTMTAAVVRGLDNSRPISTQRWYHNGAKGANGRWEDSNVEEFKRVIREELEEIVREFNTGKYDNIMFPDSDGLFNTSISNITKARTPQLYQALADLLHEYGFDKLIPADAIPTQTAAQPVAPTPVSAIMPQAPKAPKQQGLMNVHKVSLPNYQKAASRMEPVEVDSAWKIPVLQRLDAQMSDDNTTDSNVEIKRQMDKVLQAISEDDYNRTADDRKERINRKMDNYERRNMQINALLDNTVGLLPSEIRETSEQIINYISDLVTELQENPDSVEKYFPNLRTELDFKTASRREIINAVNINNLLAQAKKHFGGISESYDSFSLMEQADLILDNWETVVEFGSDILLMNEGVSLELSDNGNYNAKSRDVTAQDYDNYSEPQDEESVREQEDEQEHWQVESKTISAFNSMSDLVRLALHKCYLLDREGNQILDKWGIPKRVNKIQAVSNILYWTQGALDIKEVIEKLKLREAKHPWIGQLVDRLVDDTGKETNFQSQFYGVMHRHFQLYGIGQREKGAYTAKILNNHVATTEVLNHITALFNAANHPLFFAHSVKEEALKKLKGKLSEVKAIVDSHNMRMGDNKLTTGIPLTNEDISKAAVILSEVSSMLGYEASKEAVEDVLVEETLFSMYQALDTIANVLETQFNKQKRGNADNKYNPYNAEDSNNIRNATLKFLAPLTEEMEANNSNAIFEDGKLYQSFVIPSFLTQMFDAFGQEKGKFMEWVERNYGSSAWFKKDGRWRHPWLRMMTDEENPASADAARKLFKHHIQLNFDKSSYMRGMSPEQYTLSCITNYHSEFVNKKDLTKCPAWFRVPIQSNKPSSEFIRFYSDRSADYKKHIVENVFEMFLQEVDRIDTVRKRNRGKGAEDAIISFDERGRKFLFCHWLNDYLEESGTTGTLLRDAEGNVDTARNNELKKLLNNKLKAEAELTDKETDQLRRLVQEATLNYMQSYVDNLLAEYEESGMLKACDSIKGIHSVFASTRDAVENFLWNDFYAANSILQLTVVDKAFYKSSDELQKRLAELHAPGIRGNKYAVDYNGNPVSDGYYRTAIIGDLEGFKSNLIANIAEVFDKKIAAANGDDKKSLEALKDYLVRPPKTNSPDDKGGVYWDINVTDGQAYSSPTSYRKKAFMFGKWSTEAEDIYNRLLEGDYTLSDLKVAFQPLKPFVYGHAMQDIGTGNSPIDVLPIPFQAKNSEYLLVMADALIRGEELGRPNLLGAIFDVMEDSAFTGRERDASGRIINKGKYNGQGIDTIQFVSAIKSGGQGVIDIAQFIEDKDGRTKAYHHLKSRIFSDKTNDDGTQYNYNAFVKKLDFDYFAIQQEVPAHFKEHAQAEGSQERMIIPSELSEKNHKGETNYYEWDDVYGNHHKLTAQEFRERYEEVHAENIQDSLDELTDFLGINSESKAERNPKLSEILQDEIMSSPRYGIDLFQACQINPATGEFRIPKGDPIQGKRIEQLINSIIKNRVNKQKIAGGPIVQVTNFGTSRQLHVRFNARSGGLLLLEEEWDAQPEHEAHQKYKSYDEYKKAEQAGIAYYEVFAPIGYKEYFELFKNPDGSINVEAIDKVSPELLKIFTCRIPTEDKYSIAHAKIVGFMPAFAGDAMMFPYELTLIDDSDFDVDKRYVMQKTFFRIKENRRKIEPKLFKFLCNAYKAKMGKEPSYDVKKKFSDDVNMFLDNPKEMKDADLMMQMLNIEYEYILKTEFPFLVEWPKEGTREARNNEIIDMDWAVMSNEMTADKALNPGGFEAPKKTAYVIAAYRNTNGRYSFEELQKKSTKDLQKLASVDRDIAWFDTQVQYYRQNAAASTLIGIAAVAKVAHAVLERDNMFIDVEYFCHDHFTIADKEFHGLTHLDPTLDDSGASVGKSLGSNIGACADAAKDPWLSFVNVDLATINVYNTMLRMGMPMDDAELFLGQDVISRILKELNQRKLVDKRASLTQIISERLERLKNRYGIDSDSDNMKYLSREELIEGLIPYHEPSLPVKEAEAPEAENEENTEVETEAEPKAELSEKDRERLIIDCKVLMAFQNLSTLADAIRKPTFITRYNSVSSAVGPLVIDNIISEHKREDFAPDKDGMTGFYDEHMNMIDAKALLERHPILNKFWECFNIAEIMFSDMPTGHSQFKKLLTGLPPYITKRIYRDRQLLSKLSDFYQSFMLVQSGLINPEHLRSFIFDFPNWFMGNGTDKNTGEKLQSVKEKYPHNALIQAIKFDYSKKTGRPFLKINTTGMSENEKEKLRMAWIDLHKDSPSLSRMLFTYCFFRGGIGFNPRTFMSLVPTYVKERLIVDLADGQKASYVDTYRKIPEINLNVLEEQFVRNNWNNSTLAPLIDNKNGTMTVGDDGRLYVATKNDLSEVGDATYIRIKNGKDTTLWKLDGGSKECKVFVKLEPLGNNGEYVEISPAGRIEPIVKTTEAVDDTPEGSDVENTDYDEVDGTPTEKEVEKRENRNLYDLAVYMSKMLNIGEDVARMRLDNLKESVIAGTRNSSRDKFFVNLFKEKGLDLTPEQALEEFKKYC